VGFDFAREWPFFPDDEKLRVFDPHANVAVLIGHTALAQGGATKADPSLATLLQHLPADVARQSLAAIGTIATLRDGVERVVQNLITNPHIDVLVLCGEDSPVFFPLEGIACLYRYGVDEGRHVVAGNGSGRAATIFARDALATLSHEDIACFRGRPLEIVDCRGSADPTVFFAALGARLPQHVHPIARPSWAFLDEIDVYRWRPRVIRVPRGELAADAFATLHVGASGATLVLAPTVPGGAAIAGTGKPDGRAQRALHTLLRRGLLEQSAGWESRLAALALAAERAVLAAEFPDDASRAGLDPAGSATSVPEGAELGRPSPLELDPTGFFKIRVAYEQGTLAGDYHAADGRHVETLQAERGEDLLAAIVAGPYVGDYAARDQHIVYLAVQIARADFALRTGLRFEEGQPLSDDARKNVEHHLHAATVVVGKSLEDTWVQGLTQLRENGLLTATQKGRVAEGWCSFFLVPGMAEMTIPAAYPASEEHIEHYARELLAAAPEVRARGDYTYGDRTCHYLYDQVAANGARLRAHPDRLAIDQRWLPAVDLPATAHHRPCLAFGLWFRSAGRLHTLQIARSHDVYGGLPQNALGVARGWGRALAAASGIPLGDLCFLSISNNFRVGDDAENVRKAVQGGVHAAPLDGLLLPPRIVVADEPSAADALRAIPEPLAAVHVAQVLEHDAPSPTAVVAAHPVLAARLSAYQGRFDQLAELVARVRSEVAHAGREHSNSLLVSARDPEADREREATPLVCLQVRRQLGRLHAAAVVLGDPGIALTPLLLDLQRAIATESCTPPGSMTLVRVGRGEMPVDFEWSTP
jgi:hypothetical protein